MKAGSLSPSYLTRLGVLIIIGFASIWLAGRIVQPLEIDVQEEHREEPTPQPTKRVAVVDDDDDNSSTLIEILESEISGEFVRFPDCESFMASLQAGQKFILVVLDYQLGTSLGTWCAEEILAFDPTMMIVGYSADPAVRDSFARSGVSQFFCKKEGGYQFAKFLANILK